MQLHKKQCLVSSYVYGLKYTTGIFCDESLEGRGYFKRAPGDVLYWVAPDLREFKYVFTYPKDVLARMWL